jgi:hypothetical protein
MGNSGTKSKPIDDQPTATGGAENQQVTPVAQLPSSSSSQSSSSPTQEEKKEILEQKM